MSKQLDVSVLELMASKVCHDIISPVGAVSNGVEFLEEMGADAGDEAVSLIAFSAQQASAKLQMFRYAYGQGGADSSIKPEDIYNAFEKVVAPDGKVKQDWNPHEQIGPEERPAGLCKVIANGLMLAFDCLPKGGSISIEADDDQSFILSAKGEAAMIHNDAVHALAGDVAVDDLTPKLVHPYITGLLADYYGFDFGFHDADEGIIRFRASLRG